MYEEKKAGEIGCCEIQILLGAVRGPSKSYSCPLDKWGNHKGNAIEISYLFSDNIVGLVEIAREVRDK